MENLFYPSRSSISYFFFCVEPKRVCNFYTALCKRTLRQWLYHQNVKFFLSHHCHAPACPLTSMLSNRLTVQGVYASGTSQNSLSGGYKQFDPSFVMRTVDDTAMGNLIRFKDIERLFPVNYKPPSLAEALKQACVPEPEEVRLFCKMGN